MGSNSWDFDVFISYRQSDGTQAARWLRNRLLRYRLPGELRNRYGRDLRIYLDKLYEKASDDFFARNIEPSLCRSQHLIVVASPNASIPLPDGSPNWVCREIDTFLAQPQRDNLIAAITTGVVGQPLPSELHTKYPNIGYIDLTTVPWHKRLRWSKRQRLTDELIKIVAAVYDIPVDQLPVLRQEEARRRQRRLWLQSLLSGSLSSLMLGLLVWSILNLIDSEHRLMNSHILQGRDLFASSPGYARLHFAQAAVIAETSLPMRLATKAEDLHLADFGIRHDLRTAKIWLSSWRDESPPSIMWDDSEVRGITLSGDGKRLISVDIKGYGRIWDTETGRQLGKTMEVGAYASSPTISPDGTVVYVRSITSLFDQFFDATTGEPVGAKMLHAGSTSDVAYHPKRALLAMADGLGQIRFRNLDGETAQSPLRVGDDAERLFFSPNGRWLVVKDASGPVEVWDFEKRELRRKLTPKVLNIGRDYPWSSGFSTDSRFVLFQTSDTSAQVFDVLEDRLTTTVLSHSDSLTSASFSPDGSTILTSGMDGTARLWRADTGAPACREMLHSAPVMTATFNGKGDLVATGGRDFLAHVWDARSGYPAGRPLQFGDDVNQVIFDDLTGRVAAASSDKTVRLWHPNSDGQRFDMDPKLNIMSSGFSPDGNRFWGLDDRKNLCIWFEIGRGHEKPDLKVADVGSASWSPDGKSLYWQTHARCLMQLDVQTRTARVLVNPFGTDITEVRFLPKSWVIGVTSSGKKLRFLDIRTMKPTGFETTWERDDAYDVTPGASSVIVLRGDHSIQAGAGQLHKPISLRGEFRGGAVSPSGDRVLVQSSKPDSSFLVELFDTNSGKSVRQWSIPQASHLFDLSSDGRYFLMEHPNNGIQVYDTQSGQPVGQVMRHGSTITKAVFSPDGQLVLSTSGTLGQIWDARTGEPVRGPVQLPYQVSDGEFVDGGKQVVFVCGTQFVRMGIAPTPNSAEVEVLRAEVAMAFTLDPSTNSIRMLSKEEWEARRKRLSALNLSPAPAKAQ
ncbi:MAG: WD40 repeat domain-containing protein [Armatimonadetes bacterium]|nr:WD40 repeat domain-containing protein [Armatimonadota bacterium]